LRELGYTVVQAASPIEALQQLTIHPNVALLLTDIVMPEMNGKKLAERALAMKPGLRVIYTTGYTETPWSITRFWTRALRFFRNRSASISLRKKCVRFSTPEEAQAAVAMLSEAEACSRSRRLRSGRCQVTMSPPSE
jgi:CheY-like chemotaxis protein